MDASHVGIMIALRLSREQVIMENACCLDGVCFVPLSAVSNAEGVSSLSSKIEVVVVGTLNELFGA